MTIKKIVSVFLCAAFMITSAGAVEVYDLEPDTVPKFSLMASGSYDVMPLDITASDLAAYLGANSPIYRLIDTAYDNLASGLGFGSFSPSSYSIAWWLDLIVDKLGLATSQTLTSFLNSWQYDLVVNELGLNRQDSSLYSLGYYLRIISDSLGTRDVNPPVYSLAYYLKSLISAVNDTTSAVEDTTSAVEDTTAAVNLTTDAVQSLESFLGSLFTSPVGSYYVDTSGSLVELSVARPFEWIFRNSSIAISKSLYSSSGDSFLNLYGLQSSFDSKTGLQSAVRHGFLGLRSLIAGSESDNNYSGSLLDNQNLTSQFSATGLGPMLNRYLQEVQNDSGLLTYIFASPEDLEMKENSSSSMSAINDSFIDPDSDTSVSVSDIGTLSSAAGSIESFGATGVTPDQAFAQLGNDSIFEFFSQTTADNLDSRPASYSLRDPAPQIVTNYYSESRSEFYNLIGEGSE